MRNRLLLEWLLVAGLAVLTVCLLASYRLTERPDNLAYDALVRMRPTLKSDVVIVAIDDASLASVGRWPWPRDIHTRLIDRLAGARPAAIGYDVLFVEPSGQDAALAQAMARAGNVVLPLTFSVPGLNGAPFDLQAPVPPIGPAARLVGHADFAADDDGIVRRASMLAGDKGQAYPAIAEQLHRLVTGRASSAFAASTNQALPDNRFAFSAPILIPFSGAAGFHRAIPAGAVLRGEVPPELLRGKLVLVGSTASGSGDRYPVPSGAMPGVELLANMVDALIDGRAIHSMGPAGTLVAALVPLPILLGALLILPPRVNVLLGLGLMGLAFATSAGLLIWDDIWLPPTAALAGLLIVYPLWAWRRLEAANAYMVEELTLLRGEADALPMGAPAQPTGWLPEAIARQTALLHMAIGRVRDLRRFFADSLQALPDATLVTDPADMVLVANRAADALFGPGVGQPLGQLLARLSPDLAGRAIEVTPCEMTARDGRIFVLVVVPLTDARGNRAGSIARLTDITEIRVATRQREDELQLLTHDMRSPQASILALLDDEQEDEPNLRARIAGYARRTLKLADDFVHYARAQSGRHNEELLDFLAVLIEAADDQWALAQAKRIRVETPDDDEEYLVFGDQSLLSRMLCNLIGNAIKYSGPDTIIRCALARESGRMLRCTIADQGHGIAPEDLDAIFQPFRRSRGAEGSGAGLGLAFVKTVIQRHGGTIHVDSRLGAGTTFTLRLPMALEI